MKIEFKKQVTYTICSFGFILALVFSSCTNNTDKIDRSNLVQRHKVLVNSIDTLSSLTVGNGKFAFTTDFTGLQTFPEKYERGVPMGTQSEWGWHSFVNTEDYSINESLKNYEFHGRKIAYDVQWREEGRQKGAADYFRKNAHRLHLGMIGLDLLHANGLAVQAEEIDSIRQELNPWTGEIHSYFRINGIPVEVYTYAHQNMDLIAAKINSPLVAKGLLRIKLSFAYPSGNHTDNACDWNQPEKHRSTLESLSSNKAIIQRKLDSTTYKLQLAWSDSAELIKNSTHQFLLKPEQGLQEFAFTCNFTKSTLVQNLPDFITTAENSKQQWAKFWLSGAAVDFSECTDKRANELERRVILSQYLTKVNCSGSFPPQETGLTNNSWYGKFHLEMHWWHGVHFALWNRVDILQKSLDFYKTILPQAQARAKAQGFEGCRWPKMIDTLGINSPSGVGSFLIWQQPHIIYFAELCYNDTKSEDFLQEYANLIFETADFMASYAFYDTVQQKYILGPALIPAQERLPKETCINPPFEVVYWYWGLQCAQKWRERLGLERKPLWDKIISGFAPLAQKEGLYLAAESASDSYSNPRYMGDHPMVLGAFGMLPGSPMLDTATMKFTFNYVWNNWDWNATWGWDFPMTAMSATRLGMPEKAIEALLMDIETNTYLANGHNYQDGRLRIYLPGNGGLLSAVAMMCAGFEGCEIANPGFPKDGSWKVKWEGLKPIF